MNFGPSGQQTVILIKCLFLACEQSVLPTVPPFWGGHKVESKQNFLEAEVEIVFFFDFHGEWTTCLSGRACPSVVLCHMWPRDKDLLCSGVWTYQPMVKEDPTLLAPPLCVCIWSENVSQPNVTLLISVGLICRWSFSICSSA